MPFSFGHKTNVCPFFVIIAPQKDHRPKGGNPFGGNLYTFRWAAGAKRRQSFG